MSPCSQVITLSSFSSSLLSGSPSLPGVASAVCGVWAQGPSLTWGDGWYCVVRRVNLRGILTLPLTSSETCSHDSLTCKMRIQVIVVSILVNTKSQELC